MLEVLLCSLVTIFPDYLFRRYHQGKRLGSEITLFSVWYELRYGIVACLILTVSLITVIFYNHPSTGYATTAFRVVPIVPEANGRVAEIFVGFSADVKQGAPIFRLDNSRQEAAVVLAKRRIDEIDAQLAVARIDIAVTEGQVQQARGALDDVRAELASKAALQDRNAGIVSQREIERLQKSLESAQGALDAALASKESAQTRVAKLLPAQKATAEATLHQAEIELENTIVRAGIDGRVEQFALRVGDVVNPFMRPAGVLVPKAAGQRQVVAGFNQIEGQVLRRGMIAEATCVSRPWAIIPVVVTGVQGYIAAGQYRSSDRLVDLQSVSRPGTITVFLEPLYSGGLEGILPGSSCVVNAYSNNHERLQDPEIGLGSWLYLHVVDTVSVVHAAMLRLHALRLPIIELVLKGH